tara:strand:- start:508 stop:753 length:246 start_codon:yes stop_codon:yes gene_type:complete
MTTIARNRNEAEVYIMDVIDKLGGGTITQPLLDDSDPDFPFVGFRVVKDEQTLNVWVLRDPEGNGSGHLSIEEPNQFGNFD